MLLHDVSQTALAAAVLTLGLVILLALRSFTRLRRSVDINLGRVAYRRWRRPQSQRWPRGR